MAGTWEGWRRVKAGLGMCCVREKEIKRNHSEFGFCDPIITSDDIAVWLLKFCFDSWCREKSKSS